MAHYTLSRAGRQTMNRNRGTQSE